MKNRKLVIVAFLLISAMVVGVGYAALSGTLTITGKSTYYNPDAASVEGSLKFTAAAGTSTIAQTTNSIASDGQSVTTTVMFEQAAYDAANSTDYKEVIKYTITYAPVADAVVQPTIYINVDDILNVTKNDVASVDDTKAFTVTVAKDANGTAFDSDIQLTKDGTTTVDVYVIVTVDPSIVTGADTNTANCEFTVNMVYKAKNE